MIRKFGPWWWRNRILSEGSNPGQTCSFWFRIAVNLFTLGKKESVVELKFLVSRTLSLPFKHCKLFN